MKINRRLGAIKARANGQRFEDCVSMGAFICRWKLLKIPEGCKNLGAGKLILIKSPFDFIIAKQKTVVFFDAKTIEMGNFSHGKIKEKQVEELLKLEEEGFIAGYLIFFKKEKKIRFALASKLAEVQKFDHVKSFLFEIDSTDGRFNLDVFKGF